MGRFVNTATGVVFSVDDSKDERYPGPLHQPAPVEKASTSKSSTKSSPSK